MIRANGIYKVKGISIDASSLCSGLLLFVPAQNGSIKVALLEALRAEALNLNLHERPELVGVLSDNEYLAFYDQQSTLISRKLLQPALEKVLHNL